MFTKILVPTDLSEATGSLIKLAGELAVVSKAEVVLLHVREKPPFPAADGRGYVHVEAYEEQDQVSEQLLQAEKSQLEQKGIQVSVRTVVGSPTTQILELADQVGADLILMGAHGHRGFRGMLLGSVTEHVIRASKVPVLTVRPTRV